MNYSSGFMPLVMLQEIHSHVMLAGRLARRTVTMTWTADTVHKCAREAGGTWPVRTPT